MLDEIIWRSIAHEMADEIYTDDALAPDDFFGQVIGQVAGHIDNGPQVGMAGQQWQFEALLIDMVEDVIGQMIGGVAEVEGNACF